MQNTRRLKNLYYTSHATSILIIDSPQSSDILQPSLINKQTTTIQYKTYKRDILQRYNRSILQCEATQTCMRLDDGIVHAHEEYRLDKMPKG